MKMRLINIASVTNAILLTVMLVSTSCAKVSNDPPPVVSETTISPCNPGAVSLNKTMLKLWEDQVFYTRNYLISSLANLPDAAAVKKRLLKNEEEMGRSLRLYYGDRVSQTFTKLMKEHVTIASEVVKTAKEKNRSKSTKISDKWRKNADEIAIFLSGLNPNWSKKVLQNMLYKYLSLTQAEINSRLREKWTDDIKVYDEAYKQALLIADTLTEGIIKQFPERFK